MVDGRLLGLNLCANEARPSIQMVLAVWQNEPKWETGGLFRQRLAERTQEGLDLPDALMSHGAGSTPCSPRAGSVGGLSLAMEPSMEP
jgi:hypothetical protein